MKPLRRLLPCLVLAGIAAAAVPAVAAPAVATLAAASDLRFAVEALAAPFERETGYRLRPVFGASGRLATQMLQGAPFHLFMSADEAYVQRLAAAGITQDEGRLYALGRIGLFVPKGSALKADPGLHDLSAALKDGRLRHFAIANPEHAPYGARAREALQHAGLWQAIQGRLVLGENIAQTAEFATSGSAQGGIIALSLAQEPAVASRGNFVLIPSQWHRPLRQRMVLTKGAPPAARAFYDYLSTPAALAILARHGFALPTD